jgi:hypothetical protein
MLSQWPQDITRFSASGRRFPVNDRRVCTGCRQPGPGGHIAVFRVLPVQNADILYT